MAIVRGNLRVGERLVLGCEPPGGTDAHSSATVVGGSADGLGATREELEEGSEVGAGVGSRNVGPGWGVSEVRSTRFPPIKKPGLLAPGQSRSRAIRTRWIHF